MRGSDPAPDLADEAGFLRAVAARPDDPAVPLIYADWLDERGDPRADLLRTWADLAWQAAHDGPGFGALVADYRQLWGAADPDWRRAFAAARPWIDATLAEELVAAQMLRLSVPSRQHCRVIRGSAFRFAEPFADGWMVGYRSEPARPSRTERAYEWLQFVQINQGWVYGISTAGPRLSLEGHDTANGEGHDF